jgi:PleD family two-component response regulator
MIVEVRELSLHDPLTKAANWRFFEEYANKAIKSAIREKRAVTFTTLSSSIGSMLSRADELMYEVKKGGKNSLRHASWP